MDRNVALDDDLLTAIVALRKESVDRNPYDVSWPAAPERRSPQGERG